MSSPLPHDHPQRLTLADEVHARPPEPLLTPARVGHLAVLVAGDERAAERAHLATLCKACGLPEPAADANHLSLPLLPRAAVRLKWERHGEFSGYTVIADGSPGGVASHVAAGDAGFDADADTDADTIWAALVAPLPPGWLAAVPGRTVMAAQAWVLPGRGRSATADELAAWFGAGAVVVGSQVADGAGCAYTDFRVRDDGRTRFVLLDDGFTPRQVGRVLQRLFEIEVYRMLALLALPIAQSLSPRVQAIEAELGTLTAAMAGDGPAPLEGAAGRDEALLHELTRLAAEVEQGLSGSQFRFGACRAYSQLVSTRIAELRESRLAGLQTVDEFMARRFSPAVATCHTVSQRLHDLSERVSQASALLATRVGIARERQNQALLASMNRRAKLQLHLQQTVEGLSVAAIAYYAAGLVGYVAKAAKAAGVPWNPDVVVGLAVPVLAGAVFLAVRRARRHVDEAERGD